MTPLPSLTAPTRGPRAPVPRGARPPHVGHTRGSITAGAARLFSADRARAHRARRSHAAAPRVTRSLGSRTR
eukprot:scaffold3783_cov77-Phaeocystis_antarctica.AAC.5